MKCFVRKSRLIIAFVFFGSFAQAQNTGIGTVSPDSKLHVSATGTDSVALKVAVNNTTKLKVAANGGTSIGTNASAPANGLIVAGMLQPGDTIKSAVDPIYIASINDSVVLQAGNTTITLSASGAVRIKVGGSGGITIDGGNGNVNISGANVNIRATAGTAMFSGQNTTIQGNGVTNIYGPLVRVGGSASGSYLPAARQTDQVSVNTFNGLGSITSGSVSVLIQQ